MPSTAFDTDPDSYGARLRAKGVQVHPAATPNRHNRKPPGNNARYNGWERGLAVEHRPNGTVMPYLDGHGSEIGVKRMQDADMIKAKAKLHQVREQNRLKEGT